MNYSTLYTDFLIDMVNYFMKYKKQPDFIWVNSETLEHFKTMLSLSVRPNSPLFQFAEDVKNNNYSLGGIVLIEIDIKEPYKIL